MIWRSSPQAALKYDKFREIAGTVRYTIPPTNKNENELMMNNHHCMISTYKTSKYLDSTVICRKDRFHHDAPEHAGDLCTPQ